MTEFFVREKDGKTETIKLDDFLKALQDWKYEYDQTYHPILCQDPHGNKHPYSYFGASLGKKYIKIVTWNHNNPDSRSVYCFLDRAGNIYKSSSWKAPAKHIRGNIFTDPNFSLGKGLGHYGAAYMR
jgi:hypothetical protein